MTQTMTVRTRSLFILGGAMAWFALSTGCADLPPLGSEYVDTQRLEEAAAGRPDAMTQAIAAALSNRLTPAELEHLGTIDLRSTRAGSVMKDPVFAKGIHIAAEVGGDALVSSTVRPASFSPTIRLTPLASGCQQSDPCERAEDALDAAMTVLAGILERNLEACSAAGPPFCIAAAFATLAVTFTWVFGVILPLTMQMLDQCVANDFRGTDCSTPAGGSTSPGSNGGGDSTADPDEGLSCCDPKRTHPCTGPNATVTC